MGLLQPLFRKEEKGQSTFIDEFMGKNRVARWQTYVGFFLGEKYQH